MPRWPEKDKDKPEEPEHNSVVEVLSPAESTLHDKIDRLVALTEAHVAKEQAVSEIDINRVIVRIKRRRTEDEMRYALRVFANGLPRQRDDDCEETMNDAIGEVLALRQIVMDLMQSATLAYQNGLQSIRKMTER